MRHFLAYGHSDQVSFRAASVQQAFDFLTVPGTIAAFYPDATAAFVLSSNLDYVIDPRTPLFQDYIAAPRASHFSLAEWHGPRVRAQMGDIGKQRPISFNSTFYDSSTIQEMVGTIIEAQRRYGQRAGGIKKQLDRYRQLLADAQGVSDIASPNEQRPPSFILAPYFVTNGTDPWADVNNRILHTAASRPDAGAISAMIAVGTVGALSERVSAIPPMLSSTVFYWVHRFNERTVPEYDLEAMWRAVNELVPHRRLVNFYGGFFSICLGLSGLWGFNNGLGYSESREWPELSTTGAAPARYYLRDLHAYVSPALAQLVVDRVPDWACDCPVCNGRRVVALTYHDLKRHFALSRRWEIDLVSQVGRQELKEQLLVASTTYDRDVVPHIPPGVQRLDTGYLRRWAAVIGRA